MSDDELLQAGQIELTIEEIEAAYLRALELADAADAISATPLVEFDQNGTAPSESARSTAIPGRSTAGTEAVSEAVSDADSALTALEAVSAIQVLEAVLFVGGTSLSAKHLAELLGGSYTSERVDQLLIELNSQYQQEGRAYHVQLSEGGYRLALKSEFENVRNRVYGQGPRDVKLSQDALEVLAFVAYQQPVTQQMVAATGKQQTAGLLRQLLLRELVSLQRTEEGEFYRTTPRFLQLFGLSSLDDLPLPMDFDFK
jgi:segregation and condensation protein B